MERKMSLPIIIEVDEDGVFIVSCPTFKGCHSYGYSIDEALNNIKEAVAICRDELRDDLQYNKFVGIHNLELLY